MKAIFCFFAAADAQRRSAGADRERGQSTVEMVILVAALAALALGVAAVLKGLIDVKVGGITI